MVLIDALFIHNGGGKVLLDYLLEKLENINLSIFYLFDNRIITPYKIKESNKSVYLNASWRKRTSFYESHKNVFKKIFILGNIPPPLKTNAIVYTYFHNSIYLKVPSAFNTIKRFKYMLKVLIIKNTAQNTDFWLVQSETLRDEFINKFSQKEKVIILPFFPELIKKQHYERTDNTFFYTSNAQENKNHLRLIDAFCNAFDKTKKGKLIVTVNENYPNVLKRIKQANKENYPIENIGFVERPTLTKVYQQSEYVIFPSLTESFGLGLIEGVLMGCKIIGADLPYTYAVCEPSITFNPSSVSDIERVLIYAIRNKLNSSKVKVGNKIDELIKLLY